MSNIIILCQNISTHGGRSSKCFVLSNGTSDFGSDSTRNGHPRMWYYDKSMLWIELPSLSVHIVFLYQWAILKIKPTGFHDWSFSCNSTAQRMRHLQTPLSLLVGCAMPTLLVWLTPIWSRRITSLDLGPKSKLDCYAAALLQAGLSQLFERKFSLVG